MLFEIMDKLPLLHNSTNLNIPDLTVLRRERGLTPNHMMIHDRTMRYGKDILYWFGYRQANKNTNSLPFSQTPGFGMLQNCNVPLQRYMILHCKNIQKPHPRTYEIFKVKIRILMNISLRDSIRHIITPFYNIKDKEKI